MASKSAKDKGAWVALALAGTALLFAVMMVSRSPEKPKPSDDEAVPPEVAVDGSIARAKEGYVKIGGVQRPKTDMKAEFQDGLQPLVQKVTVSELVPSTDFEVIMRIIVPEDDSDPKSCRHRPCVGWIERKVPRTTGTTHISIERF